MQDKELGQLIAGVSSTMAAIILALLSASKLIEDVEVGHTWIPIQSLISFAGMGLLITAAFVIDYFMDVRSEELIGKEILVTENPLREYQRRARYLGGAYIVFSISFGIVFFLLTSIFIDSTFDSLVKSATILEYQNGFTLVSSGVLAVCVFVKLFSYHHHWQDLILPGIALGVLLLPLLFPLGNRGGP